MKKILITCLFSLLLLVPTQGFAMELNACKSVKNIFPNQVKVEKGVCKLEIERTELKLKHMGQVFTPNMMELAFMTSFQTIGKETYVMGEFALLEPEIQPVIDALRNANIEVSAIHNHMHGEEPRILYLHFQGMGNQQKLAIGIKKAIQQTTHFSH